MTAANLAGGQALGNDDEASQKRESVRARVGYFRRGGTTAREYYCGTCFARLTVELEGIEPQALCHECAALNVLPGR